MNLRERFSNWIPEFALKNVSYLTAGNLFEYTAGFLYGVGGAYMLGAEGWGQLVFVITVVRMFSLFFDLRIGPPVVKLIRERIEGERDVPVRSYIWGVVMAQGVAVGVFSILFLGFLLILSPWFTTIESWQTALGLFALSECLYIFRSWFASLLQSTELFKWKAIQNSATSVFRDYMVLGFMAYGGVEGACLGFLVAELMIIILLAWIACRVWGIDLIFRALTPEWPGLTVFSQIYHNARSNYVSGLLSALYSELSRIFIGGLAGIKSVGIYDIAMKFNKILQFITSPVTMYLYPRFVEKWNQTSRNEFFYTLRKYFYQLGPAYCILTIGLIVLAPWLIPLFYSDAFTQSVPLVAIILPAFALEKLFSLFSQMTFVIGQQRALVNERILELVISIPLAYVFIQSFGIYGAAWALVANIIVRVCYRMFFFVKFFGSRWIVPPWLLERS